eukprot:6175435-Pleurochrysis_carterae.AAC.3
MKARPVLQARAPPLRHARSSSRSTDGQLDLGQRAEWVRLALRESRARASDWVRPTRRLRLRLQRRTLPPSRSFASGGDLSAASFACTPSDAEPCACALTASRRMLLAPRVTCDAAFAETGI